MKRRNRKRVVIARCQDCPAQIAEQCPHYTPVGTIPDECPLPDDPNEKS